MKRAGRRSATAAACCSLVLGAVLSGGALTGAQSAAAAPAPACKGGQLSASAAGSTQVTITVTNKGPKACTLKGYPTVALAGQGSPERNKPLSVQRQGAERAVQLAVGGRAVSRLTFTPVLGEAEGYCASGAEPTVAPSLVVGFAGIKQQLGPADADGFALCGTTVRATAFRPA
ncbi:MULTISPECIES: DUF4232 domain-containing protein [unclassified Streptomyces]|uniref:DUF4232 domain-containing protein n=1 Tax=unclassified Streptomyces TaxID=2593676 RepID=UPI002E34F513|nr:MULTISPECIES: DUF4232 domain-containing protein [unclassified Streptomyces]WUC67890.1 DUF4232 domain-containing protein [Streptomyces sp. NBC_00539]